MKKQISTLLLLCLLLTLTAGAAKQKETDYTQGSSVTLPLTGFSAINNAILVTVRYIQGPVCSVKAWNYDSTIHHLYVKDGTLYLRSHKSNGREAYVQRLRLDITAPHLNAIRNSGMLNLEAQTVKAGDFGLRNSGVGTITLGRVECRQLGYSNSGTLTFSGTVTAKKAELHNSGIGNCTLTANANELEVHNSGVSRLTLNFKGGSISIHNSGSGTSNINVDCRRLTAHNSGVDKFTIAGSADDTNITTNGVAKIDTKNLNRY
jgi:hypothetical protein